jgi:hypothetical protein
LIVNPTNITHCGLRVLKAAHAPDAWGRGILLGLVRTWQTTPKHSLPPLPAPKSPRNIAHKSFFYQGHNSRAPEAVGGFMTKVPVTSRALFHPCLGAGH